MTTTYNPAEVERLITEAREDDEALRTVVPVCPCSTADLIVEGHDDGCPAAPVDSARGNAERRALANLGAMADQLEAARAEVERVHREWFDDRQRLVREADASGLLRARIAVLEPAQTAGADRLHPAIALAVKESLDGRGEARDNGAFAELVADRIVDVLTEPK